MADTFGRRVEIQIQRTEYGAYMVMGSGIKLSAEQEKDGGIVLMLRGYSGDSAVATDGDTLEILPVATNVIGVRLRPAKGGS